MSKPNVEVDVRGNTKPLERQLNKVRSKGVDLNLNSKNFSAPLGKIRGELGEFDKSLAASNARVLAFGASAGAIYAIERALSETVKATISVEKALTEVNVILGASEKQLARFGNELFNIAKKTGRSFQDVSIAAGELARQGLAMEETLKRTSDAMILARLSGLGVEESVNAITAALNGFRNAALNSTAVVDKLIAVDQAFAVSGADLAEALRRVGSTAEGAGVSLNELLGIVTAAQQITARGGAVIGNSFKTIFTRIQRPKVLEALGELGVRTKNAAGASLSATQVLKNLAKTYDTLSEAQQAQIAELVGGVFQINVLKASLRDLGGQYSIFASATEIAANAQGESAKRNAALNKTLSASLNETLQNVTKLAAGVGKLTLEPAIKNVLSIINAITEKINLGETEDKGANIGKALLGGLGKFLSGPGLALAAAALFQLFNNLRKFALDAFRTFSGLNASFKQQQQLQQGIVNILQQNPKILAQIQRGEISVDAAAEGILSTYKSMNAELMSMNNLASTLAGRLNQAGAGVRTVGGVQTIATRGGKASGYVPNFADNGEVAAMALSGMYTKSQMANPQVRRGRIFDGQGGSFMATYNGHEKKQDVIGPNGKKGTIIASPAMQAAARGFVPNFSVRMKKEDAPESVISAFNARKNKKEKWSTWSRKAGNVANAMAITPVVSLDGDAGIFTTGRSMSKEGVAQFTKAEAAKLLGATNPAAGQISGLTVRGMVQGQTRTMKDKLGKDTTFDQIVESELRTPLKNITKAMLGGSKDAKDLPSPVDVWKKAAEDTSGYPQFLGRIFEAGINSVIGKAPAKSGTWDYLKGDFNAPRGQATIYKALFGSDLSRLQAASFIDAKRSGFEERATRDSVAGKISRTPTLQSNIATDVNAFLKKNKASGYVPNFYKPLGDALKRENNAGVSKGAIRVGSDRRLASGSNPFGLAVTNTRDEPRGIKDVLARGYVPNFAAVGFRDIAAGVAPGLDKGGGDDGNKKVKDANDKNAKAKNKNTAATNKSSGSMDKLFGLTMLASLATGIFASATEGGSREMQKIGAGVNAAVSGLTIAGSVAMTIPGPIGLMLGAVAGVTAGLISFSTSISHGSDALLRSSERLDANSALLSEQGNAIQQAQQALEALKNAEQSGDAEELNAARKNYAEKLNKLDPALKGAVMAEADSKGKQRVLGEAGAKVAKDKSETDAAAETNKLLQEQLKQQAKEKMLNNVFTTLKYIGVTVAAILVAVAAGKLGKAVGAGKTLAKGKGFTGRGARSFFAGMARSGGVFKGIAKVGIKLTRIFGSLGKVFAGVVGAFKGGGIIAGLKTAGTALAGTVGGLVVAATAIVGAFGMLGKFLKEPLKNVPILGGIAKFAADKLDIFGGVLDFINAKRGEKEARKNLASKYIDPGKEEFGLTEKGKAKRKEDAKALVGMIDPAQMTDANMADLRKAANRGGEEGMIKALERMGVAADKARAYVEGAGAQTYGLSLEMTNLAKEQQRAAAQTQRLQAILDAQAAAAAAAAAAAEDANKRAMSLATALNTMAKGIQNARKQARKNQREYMMEELKGGANLAKQFQTSFQSTQQQGDINKLGINFKAAEQTEKIREKNNKAVFDAIKGQKDVAAIFEKVGKGQGSQQENAFVQRLEGTLQTATSAQGAAGAAAAIMADIAAQQQPGGALEGKGKVEIPGLLNILAQQSTQMAQAEQTRLHQLKLADLQTRLQQEQNKIDMQMKAGGGIQTFLNPKQMDDMESGFNQAIDDFKTARGRGDEVKTGQAAGNLLTNINDFFGGPMMGPGADAMKDLTVKGLEKSMRNRAFARADVLDQAARETGDQSLAQMADNLRNMDFAASAETQVAAEFKRQKMPANIEAMLQTQNELLTVQQADAQANAQTAANTAAMADALTGGAFTAGVESMIQNLPAPTIQGFDGIQTAIEEAGTAMQGAATAIQGAATTQMQADRIKELGGKKAEAQTKLDAVMERINARGGEATAYEAQQITELMRQIGASETQMASIMQNMDPKARALLGPEFANIQQRAGVHDAIATQGYQGVSEEAIKLLGPTLAQALMTLRGSDNITSGQLGEFGGVNEGQLDMGEAQEAADTWSIINRRKNLRNTFETQGKDAAIEQARKLQMRLQRRMMSGQGSGREHDEMKLRMAGLDEMINRMESGEFKAGQSDAEFFEEIMKKGVQNNQTINITIPAGASITGKEEIYILKNRLDKLEQIAGPGEVGASVNVDAGGGNNPQFTRS